MPYIAVKAYPRDEEAKKALVEKLRETVMEVWGVPEKAVSISIEEVQPEDWEEKVFKPEILDHKEKMYIIRGEKLK